MPTLSIDGREVTVPAGTTLLEAARQLGLGIPTLCFLPEAPGSGSCMACAVKDTRNGQLLPACVYPAQDGMALESETPAVHAARRAAVELLLSDHLGDCLGPCQRVCPAMMDVPQMLRQVRAGDWPAATATVKADLALPGILGRVCHAPCENGCRRKTHDEAVSIRLVERYVADRDRESGAPWLPPRRPASGMRIAIVGAGPTGLSAAWYLQAAGHACTLYEQADAPGGSLRREFTADQLPPAVIGAEAGLLERLGAVFRYGVCVGHDITWEALRADHDAVLFAGGAISDDAAKALGFAVTARGVRVDEALATSLAGVWAAGRAVRRTGKVVHSVAAGKFAARILDAIVRGEPAPTEFRPWSCSLGRVTPEEMTEFLAESSGENRAAPVGGESAGLRDDEAARAAARCLHCDCRRAHDCKLRDLATHYQARANAYEGKRRAFTQERRHPHVIFESGKCVRCGNCVRIAAASQERLGLAFVGRGFDVRVTVPLSGSLADGLKEVAAACVAACPTGALARRDAPPPPASPPQS